MKKILLILLPILLLGIEIFPSNSEDFTAYSVVQGGGWGGYLIANLFTDDQFVCGFCGVLGTIVSHAIFYNHFSTERQQYWASAGRGHFVFEVGIYCVLKTIRNHKKNPIATAENPEKIEYYEFGLEQVEQ